MWGPDFGYLLTYTMIHPRGLGVKVFITPID